MVSKTSLVAARTLYCTGGGVAVSVSPPVAHNLQTHYEELLRVIAEVGKDVKPAYTNSKISSDRLKRSKTNWIEQ